MENLPTPIEEIKHPLLVEKQVKVYVKRDDLIHPEIMGNKWRKLKYNLKWMRDKKMSSLVTMGGAFSNHIAAVAAAAKQENFGAIGLIRGDELSITSNETLANASNNGMQLKFIDRATFRKYRNDINIVKRQFPSHYFLPEGGTNDLAIKGCTEVIQEINQPFDVIITPIGTGGTMAGLVKTNPKHVIGISTLKGNFIHSEIKNLFMRHNISNTDYQVVDEYHFGGYGKTTKELINFMNWFRENFGILLDPIYTGKSFFAVWNMIKTDKFEKNLEIMLLHTGGLQGISGFNRKNENIIFNKT